MVPYPQPLAYTSMIKFTIDGRPSVDVCILSTITALLNLFILGYS